MQVSIARASQTASRHLFLGCVFVRLVALSRVDARLIHDDHVRPDIVSCQTFSQLIHRASLPTRRFAAHHNQTRLGTSSAHDVESDVHPERESRQPVRAFRFSPRLSLAAAPVPVVTLRRINTLGMHKKVVYPGSFRRTRRTDDCTFYFYVSRRFHWHESPDSPSLRDSPTSVLPVLPREAK